MANDATTKSLRSISSFKSALVDGGARANLFEVTMDSFPTAILDDSSWDTNAATSFSFLCTAAALPASNISSIDVPFRGRPLKVAGDRTIDPWTVTIINDSGMTLRRAFETWINKMTNLDTAFGISNPNAYMGTASVFQLSRSAPSPAETAGEEPAQQGAPAGQTATAGHAVLGSYQFQDIFPTNVSQIDLSYDSVDTIEEFTVEFAVNNIITLGTPATSSSEGTL